MNILLLRNNNPFTENGASANRFRGLVEGLCREGHSVTIGVVGGVLYKGEAATYKHDMERLRVEYLSHSNHYHPVWGRLNTYFFDSLIHQPASVERACSILRKQYYDIVWLTNQKEVLSLYNKVTRHIQGHTFMELNEFNDINMEETGGNFLQRHRSKKSNRLFLETIGKIDLFGVMTNTLISHYKTMAKPEAKFMHLPMTVDLSRFNNVVESDMYKKPYIGYTGSMNNHKDGVDILIKAFAKIANNYPSLHLYLAGFYHYDVPMQDKIIADFGLQERIHRVGVLSRDQIPLFIGNASLLALSRPDSHQAQGGFPTKLGEYLATGKPVCVTRVGEIPDYLEDNVSAFMAEPGDAGSFANAMNRALCDEDNAQRVGANGQKVAEKEFDADKQAHQLSEFLKENLR